MSYVVIDRKSLLVGSSFAASTTMPYRAQDNLRSLLSCTQDMHQLLEEQEAGRPIPLQAQYHWGLSY